MFHLIIIKHLMFTVWHFSCSILILQLCTKLKAIASKLKIQAAKVDKAVREAVLKGYLTASGIVKSVKEFFDEEVLSKKCEDFLPDSVSYDIYSSSRMTYFLHLQVLLFNISLWFRWNLKHSRLFLKKRRHKSSTSISGMFVLGKCCTKIQGEEGESWQSSKRSFD